MIAKMIADFKESIEEIKALPRTGYVLGWKEYQLCVKLANDGVTATGMACGIQSATVFISRQDARYVAPIFNGMNEQAKIFSREYMIDASIATLEKLIKDLESKQLAA